MYEKLRELHPVYARALRGPGLLGLFWTLAAGIALWGALSLFNGTDNFAGPALLIAAAALFPSYLWCSERVQGLPVFPLFTSSFLMTYAFPLLYPTPLLKTYSSEAAWTAAVTVSAFLCLTTAVWWICVTRPRHMGRTFLSIGGERGHWLYLFLLAASAVMSVAMNGDWLSQLSAGIFTALRGFIRGFTGIAILMLAMAWGQRKLSPRFVRLFVGWFLVYAIADAASLFLVGAIVG